MFFLSLWQLDFIFQEGAIFESIKKGVEKYQSTKEIYPVKFFEFEKLLIISLTLHIFRASCRKKKLGHQNLV